MSDITVLVAARSHAVSGRPARSRADATAAALALGLSDKARLLSAGTLPDSVARDYLALGAGRLEILECGESADVPAALLPALRDVPWVLTGTRSESEHGSGMLPYTLAAALGRPVVTDVLAVQPDGSAWIVTQALPKGARRRLRLSPPAVLAISAAAPLTLRHSLADAMAGQIVRTPVASAVAASLPTAAAAGQRVPNSKRRKLLEAKTVQSGHARMLGAIESPSTGGTVLQTGSPQTKAQAVLDYLRTHSLVQF
ncbi:electron transfer flavoprotein subunit beta/FixA family protein [Rhodoferax sp.]|uniref:electron transfer flavoprotein subunit beta/FixA family protein n=1 Tax=Rhodoferax sp. TaxID=50421 RepID=UPI00374DD3E9